MSLLGYGYTHYGDADIGHRQAVGRVVQDPTLGAGGAWELEEERARLVEMLREQEKRAVAPTQKKKRSPLMETTEMLTRAGKRGAEVAGAGAIDQAVSTLCWRTVPKPEFFQTGLGAMVEPVVLPTLIHFLAEKFPDSVPHADKVAVTCERALEGISAEKFEQVFALAGPLFSGMAAMANGQMTPEQVLAGGAVGGNAESAEVANARAREAEAKTRALELELELAKLRAANVTLDL